MRTSHASSPPFRTLQRSYRMLALFVSLALHVGVALALSRMSWDSPVPPDEPAPIVWLRTWPPPELERVTEPEAAPQPEPAADPPELEPLDEPMNAEPEDQPEPRPSEQPEQEPQLAGDAADDEPTPVDERDADDPTADDAVLSAEREPLPTAIELYDEGRSTAAAVIEQLTVEEGYSRFSRDFFDEPVAEAPNPREDMFEPGAGGKRSRSFMQPGNARTRFGRWLADTCNALSGGGIGLVFGFGPLGPLKVGTLCADENARSDLFADIKPEYLKSLPVCEEVRLESPPPGGGGLSTIKCRLVPQQE